MEREDDRTPESDPLPPTVAVSVKPSTMTVGELLQGGAERRYPRARYPLARWMGGNALLLVIFTACGGLFGPLGVLGFGGFGVLVWLGYFVLPLRAALRAWRTAGPFAVELSPAGIVIRSDPQEWKVRWLPGHEFIESAHYVFLKYDSKQSLGIPNRAFASPEARERFWRPAGPGRPRRPGPGLPVWGSRRGIIPDGTRRGESGRVGTRGLQPL